MDVWMRQCSLLLASCAVHYYGTLVSEYDTSRMYFLTFFVGRGSIRLLTRFSSFPNCLQHVRIPVLSKRPSARPPRSAELYPIMKVTLLWLCLNLMFELVWAHLQSPDLLLNCIASSPCSEKKRKRNSREVNVHMQLVLFIHTPAYSFPSFLFHISDLVQSLFFFLSLPHCPRGNRLILLAVPHSTLSVIPPPEKQNIQYAQRQSAS